MCVLDFLDFGHYVHWPTGARIEYLDASKRLETVELSLKTERKMEYRRTHVMCECCTTVKTV
eukprot:SAG31_NODE_20696_length_567_cov_1.750000_1_plen_61_part_10